MPKFQYSVDDHDEGSRYDVPTKKSLLQGRVYTPGEASRDWELMAESCADDYHSNHDGWEASWPLEFRLYEDGAEVAHVTVDCEHRPSFQAHQQAWQPPVAVTSVGTSQ